MELFGKMELNTYLCRAKKERDGLRHQRYITQTGYRTLPEFAKKETLRIIPQQFQARQHDTVQLTYPLCGSPEAGVRFARLMSVFANIRNHNLDPVEYLCDVFRRIKNTANDKLVELLAHRWQPATVSAWV